jgi:hypothetical protein
VGVSIGMAPRFATAHLATHNRAVDGLRRSFTTLHDEFLFIDENTRGIFGLQSAAYALTRLVPWARPARWPMCCLPRPRGVEGRGGV